MSDGFNYRVLVVDDEPSIREISSTLLATRGYEVRTAADGFAALVELRRARPDIIISDLSMPNMSGFELLSVVRRRFPQIPVIAISDEYKGVAPQGLIADAFFAKAGYTPEQLFTKIADLLEQSPIRPHVGKPDRAPVWVPRNSEGYLVLTCTDCLRSFSVPDEEAGSELRETRCVFCETAVRYLADTQVLQKKRPKPSDAWHREPLPAEASRHKRSRQKDLP